MKDTDKEKVINLQQNVFTQSYGGLVVYQIYMKLEQCAVWSAKVIIMGIQIGYKNKKH